MRQTAALLHKLQLDATFNFSQEQQKKHLAQAFGCAAPERPAPERPAPTAPALPHGSSRVAAFLACSAVDAPALQQQPVVAAGVANPDEISLE
jgi:hypothetical protein